MHYNIPGFTCSSMVQWTLFEQLLVKQSCCICSSIRSFRHWIEATSSPTCCSSSRITISWDDVSSKRIIREMSIIVCLLASGLYSLCFTNQMSEGTFSSSKQHRCFVFSDSDSRELYFFDNRTEDSFLGYLITLCLHVVSCSIQVSGLLSFVVHWSALGFYLVLAFFSQCFKWLNSQ